MISHYHPVSLKVIRGALEYSGWGVLRIRCVKPASIDEAWARYFIEIDSKLAQKAEDLSPYQVTHWVNGCFASDVNVEKVRYDGQKYIVEIKTERAEPVESVLVETENGFMKLDDPDFGPLEGDL